MTEPGIFRPKDEGFGKFIWNSEKGEFIGRTGGSWLKIGVFYLFYYSCLAAFFAAMMAVFYQTLDTENRPTYTPGGGGSLLDNPAPGFRPRPREENVETTLIWYNNGDDDDIKHWVDQLDDFIADYEGEASEGQNIRECSFAEYEQEKEDEANGVPRDPRPCKFQDTWLTGNCNKERRWGYDSQSPCVLLKLNRMIDWEPDAYTSLDELPENMPQDLKYKIGNATALNDDKVPPMVWVSCEGEGSADKEYLPRIELSPYDGFPAYYFPYSKVPGYKSPLVGVTIYNPGANVLINIECRIWAKNIVSDRYNRVGMVHFELLKD